MYVCVCMCVHVCMCMYVCVYMYACVLDLLYKLHLSLFINSSS